MGVKRYAQDECGANGPTRRMAIILNCQLSILNCQLSTVNCQLSIVNCHLSNYNEINNRLLIYN